MKAESLFALPVSLPFREVFLPDAAPWEWLPLVAAALEGLPWGRLRVNRRVPPGVHVEGNVFVHADVKLPPYAVLKGPAWIGAGTEVRPGAFVRGNVIVGEHCVLGNACEFKNCLLMDRVEVPHFSYVGDSILGSGAHLGAGVVLANLRLDRHPVPAHTPEGRVETGLRKFGAILGEEAEAGCNAVLQPGSILGKRAAVLPNTPFSGYLPEGRMACLGGEVKVVRRP